MATLTHGPAVTYERRPLEAGLRAALVLAALVLGVLSWTRPVERPLEDLLVALSSGSVRSAVVEVSADGTYGSRPAVRWSTGGWRDSTSRYSAPPPGAVDEVLTAIAASPAEVQLRTAPYRLPSGTDWSVGYLAAVPVLLLGLWLLVNGRTPRLATRWAWFWLATLLPVTGVLFLLLEPVPLWQRRAGSRRRRLTGGWALLLAAVVGGLGHRVLPEADRLLWSAQD